MIAVAHPDLFASRIEPAIQKRQGALGFHEGATEFSRAAAAADLAAFDLAAEVLHHHLLSVTAQVAVP